MELEQDLLSEDNRKEFMVRYWLIAAEQLQNINMFADSQNYADLAHAASNQLTRRYPENTSYLALLSNSQLLQAKLLIAANKNSSAIELCREVEQKLAEIIVNNKDPRYSTLFAKALDCQGKLDSEPSLITMLRHNGVVNFTF